MWRFAGDKCNRQPEEFLLSITYSFLFDLEHKFAGKLQNAGIMCSMGGNSIDGKREFKLLGASNVVAWDVKDPGVCTNGAEPSKLSELLLVCSKKMPYPPRTNRCPLPNTS